MYTFPLCLSANLQGYTHPREYIVTEWPLSNTCSDIWSLVYDHDCSSLVVLCNPTSTVSNVTFSQFLLRFSAFTL